MNVLNFFYAYFLKECCGLVILVLFYTFLLEEVLLICQFQIQGLAISLRFYHVYF